MAEETKFIEISVADIGTDIKKHLSIIGKRQIDKLGNTLFGGMTLSSIEMNILPQEIRAALGVFASKVAPIVKTYVDKSLPAMVTFDAGRINTGKRESFESCFRSFVNAYTLNAIIGMNYPDMAKKYADEANLYLESATKLVFSKDRPATSEKSVKDMTGVVILGEITKIT